MADDSAAQTESSQVSDPYVIYQLRKPSQRGTAVIPRFVPNTHAPAFSPANYRFARVWATNDNTPLSPSSLLHVPRSFEYAGSLGSESSFWSDTSSWVSVSTMRTAPSEARAPLLHSPTNPVSAASFFNDDFDHTRLRPSIRPSSTRSSDLDSPVRADFRYPPALSESVSEDAVIDDLLSMRNNSHTHSRTNHQPHPHKHAAHKNNYSTNHGRSATAHNSSHRSTLLPAITRKRRSLWQWLFCSDTAAASTSIPSAAMSQSAAAMRERLRSSTPSTHTPNPSYATKPSRRQIDPKSHGKDRVPNADKDFINRTQKAADTPAARNRSARRRSPSFEILRGKPKGSTRSGRSMSWSFMPKAFLGKERESNPQKDTKEKKKKKAKTKDQPRQVPAQDFKEPRKSHRIVFQKSSSRKNMGFGKDLSHEQKKNRNRAAGENQPNRTTREDRPRMDRARQDRPRGDRPREQSQPYTETPAGAPIQKSVVPSLREKHGSSTSSQSQRMRSAESNDPVTSRISSDLSSTTYGRTNGSDSGHSTPVNVRQQFRSPGHELDPAAQGVSSDVSSHVSGAVGKGSPAASKRDPSPAHSIVSSSPDIQGVDVNHLNLSSPYRASLFAYPSTSSGSDGFTDQSNKATMWEAPSFDSQEHSSAYRPYASTPPEFLSGLDPVARAKEKNRARSGGDPLSYLMKQHDAEGDVNTQSTGLTSLADESVSTHKTVSAVGDDYHYMSHIPGGLTRNAYVGDLKRTARMSDMHEGEAPEAVGATRPIFQNSAIFSHQTFSPSHGSSGASPRRFHSDWSDPHATDIEVYCQCNCSCVYEEECRRSCELIYGRSPSVSSTRSRRGYEGFKTLPPAIETSGRRTRNTTLDMYGNSEREPAAFQGGDPKAAGQVPVKSKKTLIRANAVDELPDPSSQLPYRHTYGGSNKNVGPGGTVALNGVHKANNDARQAREHWKSSRPPSQPHASHGGHDKERRRRTAHGVKAAHESRVSTPRPAIEGEKAGRRGDGRHRHRSSSQNEGRQHSKDEKQGSSRRDRKGGGSQRSSSHSRREESLRGGVRDEKSVERRRREGEHRTRAEGQVRRTEAGRQMGTSYVVKRSGLPPSSQQNIPQPYRAGHMGELHTGYEEEDEEDEEVGRSGMWEHEAKTRVHKKEVESAGPKGFEVSPVMELEYEARRALRSGKSGVKSGHEAKRERRKAVDHGDTRRSGHEHRRHHASSRDGQTRSSSRQASKSSNRSRTPLFGVF